MMLNPAIFECPACPRIVFSTHFPALPHDLIKDLFFYFTYMKKKQQKTFEWEAEMCPAIISFMFILLRLISIISCSIFVCSFLFDDMLFVLSFYVSRPIYRAFEGLCSVLATFLDNYILSLFGPRQAKRCLRACAKCTDQIHPTHAQSLIRAFVFH